ncbi:MAG: dipicolinate synthase subunit DpsA [Syntrophomonadaceae bacterium]|jgi:dipicolinate synthase subunit A|nr:dipicolinate synthase subunit DpsA [Syntrophomonadaceae bacterium]
MSSALSGIKITVVGGDDRENVLISELIRLGATVAVVGFPRNKIKQGGYLVDTVEEACRGAEVLILPMPGTNPQGHIRAVYCEEELELTEKAVKLMAPNALVIIGTARSFLQEWSRKYRFTLLEIAEMDEIAIPNSIPTAEGAIQIAMEELPVTIHGIRACVLGFGRVGTTLARKLNGLNAVVTVVSREPAQLARAQEMGCYPGTFNNLASTVQQSQVIFNTVPEVVLNREVLRRANPDVLIVDLATQPGGTDFEAAYQFGIKAILAPGLPGKVAPLTAGKVLADVVPRMVVKELSKLDQGLLYG